jgi:hypothetical protein
MKRQRVFPERQNEDTVLEGVLIPAAWSSDGEASRFGLMTFDEAEYRIDRTVAEAHDLRAYLRRYVRILGRVRGGRVVDVKEVRIIETGSPASPSSDQWEDRP